MNNLVLLPTMAQDRKRFDFSDAEVIEPVEEVTSKVKLSKHFIEANTVQVTMEHLVEDCVTPVFAKDNEPHIAHT